MDVSVLPAEGDVIILITPAAPHPLCITPALYRLVTDSDVNYTTKRRFEQKEFSDSYAVNVIDSHSRFEA
jgi:hypothetical protein